MNCINCGSKNIEFTRLEKIGMDAADLLLEKCEQQKARIRELEESLMKYKNGIRDKCNEVHDLKEVCEALRAKVILLKENSSD